MALHESLILVFGAGFITALATGLGAIPFFFFEKVSQRWNVWLWGLASGIMVSASLFGLILEGLKEGTIIEIIPGIVVGVLLVIVSHRLISGHELKPRKYKEADLKKLILILGILTVHSFPEGVAIGVSFADLNTGTGYEFLGFTVPILAIFMTIAISIHNIPEGLAISIPLRAMNVSEWRMVGWAIFSSLPQPVGAVIAYYFVRLAREFLPFGFGFAAGAMVYLVATEFVPEALETGKSLPGKGRTELVSGFLVGILVMTPLAIY